VLVDYAGPININLPVIMLTNIGKELLRIIDPSDDLDNARVFAENLPHAGLISVKYGIMNEEGTAIGNTVTAGESPPSEDAVGQ
jgi:hypothetical protein